MCPFCIIMWFISCLYYSQFHRRFLTPPWKFLTQLWHGKENNLQQETLVGKSKSTLPTITGKSNPNLIQKWHLLLRNLTCSCHPLMILHEAVLCLLCRSQGFEDSLNMGYRPTVVFRAAAATTVTIVSKVCSAFSTAGKVGTAAVAATAAAAAASGAKKKPEPHGEMKNTLRVGFLSMT
ncbi:hypothetical protein M758_2G027000 [Ceratodon purpureus]|nr:hypothetical protein M758_2G027000 [Ceratodon purpureus]